MGDTCFPSHLPTSSLRGAGGTQASHNPLLFASCLKREEEKKKRRKGGEKAKFVHRDGKLISKVKRKECVLLKNGKKKVKLL